MIDQTKNHIGSELRSAVTAICSREGISQAEVARRSGLDPASLCRSFNNPGCGQALRAVCSAFGLKIAVVPAEE